MKLCAISLLLLSLERLTVLVDASFVNYDQLFGLHSGGVGGMSSRLRAEQRHQGRIQSHAHRARLVVKAGGSGGIFGDDTRKGDRTSSSSSSSVNNRGEKTNEFATGEELKRLRVDLENLNENLQWAQAMNDEMRVEDLLKAIRNGEKRDPDVAYANALCQITETRKSTQISADEKKVTVEQWQDRAQRARSYLPRFKMDGLWVGNYGDHGLELVNVTYVGDTLIATKVTGDETVPRGQVSFTADLAPPSNASSGLTPLRLTVEASSSASSSPSGASLPRYSGKGQIAKPGFKEHRFVEGQLVMFDRHFSFVWIPTRHHVLFRRPTPQQTLDLLRDTIAKEDELANMRSYLTRCMEMDMTDSLARQCADQGHEPFRRISLKSDLEKLDDKVDGEKGSKRFNFWNVHKWQQYFDNVIRDEKKDGKKNDF